MKYMLYISVIQPQWQLELVKSYEGDEVAAEVIIQCVVQSYNLSLYTYHNGMIKYKGKWYVGTGGDTRKQVIQVLHTSGEGGSFRCVSHLSEIVQAVSLAWDESFCTYSGGGVHCMPAMQGRACQIAWATSTSTSATASLGACHYGLY